MRHVPVLLEEVLDVLNLAPGKIIVDATLGDGGHSEAILEKTAPDGTVIGIDADSGSLTRAQTYLERFGDRVTFVHNNFVHLQTILDELGIDQVDGILIDLGWSSSQFAESGKGFSFEKNEPLDMRFTPETQIHSAADLINESSGDELQEIFEKYGEERQAKAIAERIVTVREGSPIETTTDLVDIILAIYREKMGTDKKVPWIGGLHPATKVFQALRIAVNDELSVIEEIIPIAIERLSPCGRLAIISFHSLEDRIVKHAFKAAATIGDVQIMTKKPIVCSPEEADANPPSRSAKLRVAVKKPV